MDRSESRRCDLGEPVKLHPETLIGNQGAVMRAAAPAVATWEAYLAGGMAVALQLGHRVSADFDWFTRRTVAPEELLATVKSLGFPVEVRQNDEGTFLGQVGGIDFSVFRYRYDVVGPPLSFQGCPIASLADIGAMKLAAICQRAVKRDYVDVHAIVTRGKTSLGDIVAAWKRKYPGADVSFALHALTYFKDVEPHRMPEMLVKTTWEEVKRGLEVAVKRSAGH
jgi:hypothetical protein